MSLTDQHGRTKRKLRLSLTDRCNFRCRYCLPEHPRWLPQAGQLRNDELLQLSERFIAQGIEAIRLTGGEPLLRPDLVELVAALHALRPQGLKRLSMSTNASRLAPKIAALKAAGLDDLNISLDALDPALFRQLTGAAIAPVLDGIEAALALQLPVKLNAVLMRGHNEREILPLIAWAGARGLNLRFIEFMPLDAPGAWSREQVVDEDAVLAVVRQQYQASALPRGADPAAEYRLDNGQRIGFISTVSKPFCGSCDRLRLTASGELFSCLFGKTGAPLGQALRAGASVEALDAQIRETVWHKQKGYIARPGPVERPLTMHAMGG